MSKQLCNRCGDRYHRRHGTAGKLELAHGRTKIEARLCPDCYADIVKAYKSTDSNE